jgi:hypothetical protein
VESLFAASLHISDFVQTQNEAKILTEEVPEKRIINTKTGVPRSPGKPRFPGAYVPKEYNKKLK